MTQQGTICQVLHSLHVGGAEMLAAALARGLRGQYRFVFACLDEVGSLGEQLRREGFEVYPLARGPGLSWSCAWRLARFLRQQGVGVLHAHQYTPFFYALLARFFAGRLPLLFTEHGRHFPDYPRRKRIWVNRLLLRRHDRVVAVGEAVRQALIHNEGIAAGRVEVIYNGIPLAPAASPSAEERSSIRKEMGAQDSDWLVIQVARLDYLKDHATALRTLSRLLPHCPRVRLVLVGEGPERPAIEDLIARLQLRANVSLLGLRRDVPRLLSVADAFLLTSISEGIPLTVIEAMAAQLPVVATRVGGLPEVVQDGQTGLLSPSGDDGDLANQLRRLHDDAALGRQMGARGRQRAEQLFSQERMQEAYLRCYRHLLGEPVEPILPPADSSALLPSGRETC